MLIVLEFTYLKEGMKEGMKKGMKEGMKKGVKEGMKKGMKDLQLNNFTISIIDFH